MDFYYNIEHTINNILTIIVLSFGNIFLVRYVLSSSRKISTQGIKQYKRKREVLCLFNFLASLILFFNQES